MSYGIKYVIEVRRSKERISVKIYIPGLHADIYIGAEEFNNADEALGYIVRSLTNNIIPT